MNNRVIRKIAEEHYYSKSGYLNEYIKNKRKCFDYSDEEYIKSEESWIRSAIEKYLKLTNKTHEKLKIKNTDRNR